MDLRVIRTRQLIKDAVIDLLHDVELNKLTVNRIAKQANINRVTFYLHYQDIPDMLEKMAEEMIENMEQTRTKPDDANTKAEWKTLVNLLEHIAENANFFKVILVMTRIPSFYNRFLKNLEDIIEESTEIDSLIKKAEIQKDITNWYITSAISGTIITWLKNDMPYTPHYLAQQISFLFQIMKWDMD